MASTIVDIEEPQPADGTLAQALAGLSNPVRIALLRALRAPRALKEIRVRSPAGAADVGGPERALARQSVKDHVDRLVEIGVVRTREAKREYGSTIEYVLDHQAVFMIAEQFRDLARLRPSMEQEGKTVRGVPVAPAYEIRGPCLVLVKGVEEGRMFPLSPGPAGREQWLIGRRRGLQVSLDFDPFVSSENAVLVRQEGTYFVQDLPDSRNGTELNFKPLARGGRHALRTGDLLGVGRTLLLFRE